MTAELDKKDTFCREFAQQLLSGERIPLKTVVGIFKCHKCSQRYPLCLEKWHDHWSAAEFLQGLVDQHSCVPLHFVLCVDCAPRQDTDTIAEANHIVSEAAGEQSGQEYFLQLVHDAIDRYLIDVPGALAATKCCDEKYWPMCWFVQNYAHSAMLRAVYKCTQEEDSTKQATPRIVEEE